MTTHSFGILMSVLFPTLSTGVCNTSVTFNPLSIAGTAAAVAALPRVMPDFPLSACLTVSIRPSGLAGPPLSGQLSPAHSFLVSPPPTPPPSAKALTFGSFNSASAFTRSRNSAVSARPPAHCLFPRFSVHIWHTLFTFGQCGRRIRLAIYAMQIHLEFHS